MRVAVHQPNYAPWCGYFAKMTLADVFVLQDDVQYSRGGYVNRVQIRTGKGAEWLTMPVPKGSTGLMINELKFGDSNWSRMHVRTLKSNYRKAAHFDEVIALIEPIYAQSEATPAAFNMRLIRAIASYLGIHCQLRVASEVGAQGKADERLADLMRRLGGTTYISGAGGQNYQEEETFATAGAALEVRVYKPVPYDQGGQEFLPGLSVLDAMFHLGSRARDVLVYS
jgi:hypothetical protein